MIEETSIGKRLDQYVAETGEITRSAAQKWIETGAVTVNGRREEKNYRLRAADCVIICPPKPVEAEAKAQDIPLSVVYMDEDLAVINKPKGMVVHPAPGNPDGTLVNALLSLCEGQLSGIGGVIRPGIVHRIDKDTSGLLVVAKNDAAHVSLAAQIASHQFERSYLAMCRGNLKQDEGWIDAPIGRHPVDRKKMAVVSNGKTAQTHFRVLSRFGEATLISCRLKTGRTHQIRVHMASKGHPLLGDTVYGGEGTKTEQRLRSVLGGQCLHAATIAFEHPRTGEPMRFEAPLPDWFETVLEQYRIQAERNGR